MVQSDFTPKWAVQLYYMPCEAIHLYCRLGRAVCVSCRPCEAVQENWRLTCAWTVVYCCLRYLGGTHYAICYNCGFKCLRCLRWSEEGGGVIIHIMLFIYVWKMLLILRFCGFVLKHWFEYYMDFMEMSFGCYNLVDLPLDRKHVSLLGVIRTSRWKLL